MVVPARYSINPCRFRACACGLSPRVFEPDWERFDGFTPTFTHPALTHEELLFLLGSAYRLDYIRPSFVTNYLRISAPRVRQLAQALDVHGRRRHASEMAMMERSLSC